jgi:hypothetical protein
VPSTPSDAPGGSLFEQPAKAIARASIKAAERNFRSEPGRPPESFPKVNLRVVPMPPVNVAQDSPQRALFPQKGE